MIITGTIVNSIAVIIGSIIGLSIKRNIPERVRKTAVQGISLFTLYLGVSMTLKTQNILILIFSILIGSLLGAAFKLEEKIESMSVRLKRKFGEEDSKFSEGIVTAFLLFCMGSMTVLGAIEEGLGGSPDLLFAKSALDGFSSIALASTFGTGVLFSFIPLLIYQGGLTLLAVQLQGILTQPIINEITASGGLILLGLGINLLGIKKLKIMNFLPALLVAGILAYLFA